MPDTAHRHFRVLEGLALPDRYAIRRLIAEGGMAAVWCAHDRVLGRNVAIKLISPSYARDQDAVRRFNREARAAARLSSHRHVVTIYDVGQAIDRRSRLRRPFIVMEYLAGGTAADALRVGALSTADASRWIQQAAAALDYAHTQGVIHRDIKPANLLLDCERIAYVADFGIAQIGTEDTFGMGGQMLGTAAYIAPEQVLGQPATEASDRYALAVAAFELLAGQQPFTAEQFTVQARQHLEDDPPSASSRNPSLPDGVDRVLARGMAKQPEERWATAEEFAVALADALSAPRDTFAAVSSPAIASIRGSRLAAAQPRRTAAAAGSSTRRRPRRRVVALGALAAAALGVGLAAAASLTSGPPHASLAAAPGHGTHGRRTVTHHAAAPRPRRPHHAAPHPASTVPARPAAATTPPPTAVTLQARGHELMVAGDYPAAIAALRKALSAAGPGSLTYAYALFDLGRSLRLAGDPKAAVPILWQRMKIPNQTGTVRLELQLALQELGARARAATPPANTDPRAGSRGPGAHDGGAGGAGAHRAGARAHGHDQAGQAQSD